MHVLIVLPYPFYLPTRVAPPTPRHQVRYRCTDGRSARVVREEVHRPPGGSQLRTLIVSTFDAHTGEHKGACAAWALAANVLCVLYPVQLAFLPCITASVSMHVSLGSNVTDEISNDMTCRTIPSGPRSCIGDEHGLQQLHPTCP